MVSQLMSQALDDLARRRRISRSLSLPEILRPMWVAATNIRERDPEKGLRLMAALVIISLSNDEKKPLAANKWLRVEARLDRGP